jgi:hypothetical protein
MDIKNMFDFESKIDFLLKSYDENIIDNIKHQESFLDSETANNNFSKIENYLNDMYEKVRVLEEVIDYAKIYVNNEIDTTITECRDLLSEIENMNDNIFNDSKNFKIINVPLSNDDVEQSPDRDGTSLKICEIYNNVISLSGTIKNTIDIKDVSVKREEQAYESNYKELLDGEPYRVHYLLDAICKNGVSETIKFDFSEPREINSIKIKLSNCKITDIIYMHEDNTETIDSDISKGVIPVRTVKGIKLALNSTNYSPKSLSVSTTENNKFEDLDKAWKEYHEEVKEKDYTYSKSEYKNQMCNYLEEIYLKEVK